MLKKRGPSEKVRQSTLGARGFYFVMYFCFFVAVFKYPNQFSQGFSEGAYFYMSSYIIMHIISVYYFVTAGDNPGWVDET